MKKILFYFALTGIMGLTQAQEKSDLTVGDELLLGQASGSTYLHIDFPRKNTIIKRGGIANFNNLVGQTLVIHQILVEEDGTLQAILKKKNGGKFFRFFPKIQCDLTQALDKGELRVAEKENALAIK